MTQNKIMEGYRMLRNEFNVTPENAAKAMSIVDEFCRNQRCDGCSERSGECVDCKGNQEKEWLRNAGFSHANDADEIIKTIAAIGEENKEINKMGKDLVQDFVDLKSKIQDIDDFDDFEINPNFFKAVDQVNRKLNQLEKINPSAVANRLDDLEEKIRHPVSQNIPKFNPSEKKIMTPIKKRPFFKTDLERGLGFPGNDMARQVMRKGN